MQTLLKIVGILIILFFLAFGIVALLNPTALMILPAFAWSPDGIAGLSAGRGIIASHFLTLGLVAVYALVKAEYKLFYVPALGEFTIVFGRLLSMGLDGYDQSVLGGMGVEFVVAAGSICVAKYLQPKAV